MKAALVLLATVAAIRPNHQRMQNRRQKLLSTDFGTVIKKLPNNRISFAEWFC